MIRLYLIGMKGLISLKLLEKRFHKRIELVTIGRDSKVQNDYSKEIEKNCLSLKIPFNYRGDSSELESDKTIAGFAIGWKWLISTSAPVIVFHDSLLPRHRGFNPLVTCLINKEPKIGVTALKATSEFDAGPICGQRSVRIKYPIKIERAIEKVSKLYAALLNQSIEDLLNGTLSFEEQDEEKATYSLWRDEEDYSIDWSKSSEEIQDFINAVGYPYQGASTVLDGTTLRIFDARSEPDVEIENRQPGKVLFKNDASIYVVCGYGLLKISKLFEKNKEYDFSNKFRLRFK